MHSYIHHEITTYPAGHEPRNQHTCKDDPPRPPLHVFVDIFAFDLLARCRSGSTPYRLTVSWLVVGKGSLVYLMKADIHGQFDSLIHLHPVLDGVTSLGKFVQTEQRERLHTLYNDRPVLAFTDFVEDLVDPIRSLACQSRRLRSTEAPRRQRLRIGILRVRAEG